MSPKLRSKAILVFQDSVSDVAKAAQEGLVLAMVEQFERNTTNFLQGEFESYSPFGQEASIGNINDDDICVPNTIEFQAMINNLQRLNALARQHFDEKMAAQVEAESKQLKVLAEKTKVMSKYAQALIDEAYEHTRKHPSELRLM